MFTKRFAQIKAASAELKTMVEQMEKNHSAYKKGMKDLDHVTAQYKKSLKDVNMSKKDSEKVKGEYEKQVIFLQETSSSYRKSIGIAS